jgi:predicted AlkP superfamily phosphohydrolase/phosphomutase
LPRVVVLGLDGLSHTLVERLTREGVMPRLAGLLPGAASGAMQSTLPEISPVAWTTFFTASSPSEHGIFGFTDFQFPSYSVRFNSSGRIQRPALWDWLGLRGRRSVVLNVPMTFPAKPLSGIMVSGFLAADLNRAGYPAWVASYLKESGYRLEADFDQVHRDREAFLKEIRQTLAGRAALLDRFWDEAWDFFFLAVTDTDRMNHFFYGEYEAHGPIHGAFLAFYRQVDEIIGRVIDRVAALWARGERDLCLVLLSDHGFCGVKEEFHLNRWLQAHGLQSEVGPEARVLALDPTRLYLNQSPRFERGRVRPAEASALLRDLQAGLQAERAVEGIVTGRDIYGPGAPPAAPDLVVLPAPGYEFKARFTSGPVYTPSPLQGTHTRGDAFYLIRTADGPSIHPRVDNILDLGRFLFANFDLDRKEMNHEPSRPLGPDQS